MVLMKKGTRVFAFVILSLFLVSMIAGVVSAATTNTQIIDSFQNVLNGNWTGFNGFLSAILTPEILFGLLIFLVIFAILSQINLFKQDWLKVSTSVIIAILAAGFINTDWLLPILNQYTALGITISFILPFVLLFIFVRDIMPNNQLMQRLVWFIYTIVVIANFSINYDSIKTDAFAKNLYWLIIVLSVIMLAFGAKILNLLWKEKLKEGTNSWKKMQDLIREGDKAKAIEYARSFNMGASEKAQIAKALGISVNEI